MFNPLNDLGEFFFDFGELVTLRFADGTTRAVTGIFDDEAMTAALGGAYDRDTSHPMLTVRSSDVQGMRYKADGATVRGKAYELVTSPAHDGTGLAVLQLALAETL